MKLTVSEFKSRFNWQQVLNLSVTDPRWLQYLNEALQRLMAPGMWVGTTGRYQVCVREACLTWPRTFDTIEAMEICNRPVPIHNQWFEFLENGPGRAQLRGCARPGMLDRGSGHAMFDDTRVNSVIRLYPQYSADVGKTVTIRGFDMDGHEVLTNSGNTQGEIITLAQPYVDSTTIWGPQVFRDVIKDVTKGYVRAFSYDATLPPPPATPQPSDTPLKAMAAWEPTETLPDYRRSYIPEIDSQHRGCGCNNSFTTSTTCLPSCVTVIAKHLFIPVESDLDMLPLGNAPAIKLAMRSVMLEERGDADGARRCMQGTFDPIRRRYTDGAIPLLEEELSSHQGDGTVITLRRDPNYLCGGAVQNFI